MRYTVEWDDAALVELADLYNRSTDKNSVTVASNQVDRELSVHPNQKGQDFYGDRLLIIPPLHVIYSVNADAQEVRVLSVYKV